MIVYFSATGNCKYVAERIAAKTGDAVVSLTNLGEEITLEKGERLGFVTPTYFQGLPSIVEEVVEHLKITGADGAYTFYVATYGTFCGQTGTFMARLLEAKGITLSARYSVKMPDSWTPMFNLTDKAKVAKTCDDAEPLIEAVIGHVENRDTGDYMRSTAPMLLVKAYRPTYKGARKTAHLHVTDSCIGCGLCARKCPCGAIEMRDKHPVWKIEQCTMCLGCLHRCPKFAIQYDGKTQSHGQYIHPKISVASLGADVRK